MLTNNYKDFLAFYTRPQVKLIKGMKLWAIAIGQQLIWTIQPKWTSLTVAYCSIRYSGRYSKVVRVLPSPKFCFEYVCVVRYDMLNSMKDVFFFRWDSFNELEVHTGRELCLSRWTLLKKDVVPFLDCGDVLPLESLASCKRCNRTLF